MGEFDMAFFDSLLRSTVYVRIQPDRLSVLHVESGKECRDAPILALALERRNGKTAIISVGHEAITSAAFLNRQSHHPGLQHCQTLP